MAQKFPPPPFLTGAELQKLNLWLISIQSILNSGGSIDPSQVEGLEAAYVQLAIDTFDIFLLQGRMSDAEADIATLQTDVLTLQGQVVALLASVAALDVRVTALEARPTILNGGGVPAPALGNNGDLYIDNGGVPGACLYAKTGGVWLAV